MATEFRAMFMVLKLRIELLVQVSKLDSIRLQLLHWTQRYFRHNNHVSIEVIFKGKKFDEQAQHGHRLVNTAGNLSSLGTEDHSYLILLDYIVDTGV